MEEVASHLRQEALRRTDVRERDNFGRSAFNRYYYSTFTAVDSALGSLRSEWHGQPHKTIPDLLRGQVMKSLKAGSRLASQVGDQETVSACQKAIALCHQLAQLMELGYATRVTADYKADVQVDFRVGTDFSLASVPVSDAQQWPGRATACTDSIRNAWRQIT